MKMYKKSFMRAFLRKWRKLRVEALNQRAYRYCQYCKLVGCMEEEAVPRDVPRGHMVVYVGEECKRFVIRVTLLNHPLFQALLDRAQEVYEFRPDAKLCIPCNEKSFLAVLRCIGSQQDRRVWLCF